MAGIAAEAIRRRAATASFWIAHALRTERVAHPPLLVNLEPTNLCNLRCPFCPVSQTDQQFNVSQRGLMRPSVFERIATQIAPFRPLVAINMGGESTLHKALPGMIRRLSDVGCYVFLDTNATKLDAEKSRAIIGSGLREIVMCFDGEGDSETYESMRKGARFAETIENIRNFLALWHAAAAPKPKAIVKNIRYYRPGEPLCPAPGVVERFADQPPSVYRATWADYWPAHHQEKLAHQYDVEPFGGEPEPCTNLWKKLAISWDGRVYACCLDLERTEQIGDLMQETIWEIWNGAPMRRLRRLHRQRRHAEVPLCSSCTMVRRRPPTALSGLMRLRRERFTKFADQPGRPSLARRISQQE